MSDAASNVTAMTTEAVATVGDCKAWIEGMADKGYYPSSTARFRVSAIESLSSILTPDEPRTARWFLDHLDEITRRWATKKSNPGTAPTYLTRAKGGLEDYLEFLKDPVGFKPRRRESDATRKEKPSKSDKGAATPPSEASAPPAGAATTPAMAPPPTWRTYPIGAAGESIEYRVPQSFTVKDALKFAIHLATLAKDFDPTSTMGLKVFALARTTDEQ